MKVINRIGVMYMTYTQLYETSAVNTGGREGVSYLADDSFQVTITSPTQKSGADEGVNPEQLFALGYAACFNSALSLVLQNEKIKAASLVTAHVRLLKGEGADFRLGVELEVGIDGLSLEDAQAFAEKAHQVCPYSKAVSGNIEVNVKAVEYDASKAK